MPHGEVAKYGLGLSGAAAIEWLARHKPAALLSVNPSVRDSRARVLDSSSGRLTTSSSKIAVADLRGT